MIMSIHTSLRVVLHPRKVARMQAQPYLSSNIVSAQDIGVSWAHSCTIPQEEGTLAGYRLCGLFPSNKANPIFAAFF
jgi:hypothetical protein